MNTKKMILSVIAFCTAIMVSAESNDTCTQMPRTQEMFQKDLKRFAEESRNYMLAGEKKQITNLFEGDSLAVLNEKQVAAVVYAEMVLKVKPQLSIENFRYEDGSLISNNGVVTITPLLEKAYFITYDNGNSDLHIPAVALNTVNLFASKMVVYNRSGDVFYEIEVMIPKGDISNRALDYALIPDDYNGILATYNSNGVCSWWSKYKQGKVIATSEPVLNNDEMNYKKHIQGVPTVNYPDGKNRQGVLSERFERSLQGSGWRKSGIKF